MRVYSEKYDAFYDDETNEWLEAKCLAPTCSFCANRPEKPMEMKQDVDRRPNIQDDT